VAILWKLVIDVKVNRVFFQSSLGKALIPVGLQVCLLATLALTPGLFNPLIYELIKEMLV
jgi:hypothetical protein